MILLSPRTFIYIVLIGVVRVVQLALVAWPFSDDHLPETAASYKDAYAYERFCMDAEEQKDEADT